MKPHWGKISILFVPEEEGETRSIKLSRGLIRFLMWFAILLGLLVICGVVSYFSLAKKASRYDQVLSENLRLLGENRRIIQLAKELEKLKSMDLQIRRSMGIALGLDSVYDTTKIELSNYDFTPHTETFAGCQIEFESPVEGLVSRGFSEGLFPKMGHRGVDLALPEGTLINAAGDGWVVFFGWHHRFGNLLIIQHPGDYLTLYGHNRTILVELGETVSAGQPVAISGNSGQSSAPHLHFEIRHRGKPINPALLIPELNDEALVSNREANEAGEGD